MFAFHDPGTGLLDDFAQADVFVLPSRYDGWGVVVNQALAAGLPIITSDEVGAGFDLVEPGSNGFRVRAGEVDDLHRAQRDLGLDRDLLALVAAQGDQCFHRAHGFFQLGVRGTFDLAMK